MTNINTPMDLEGGENLRELGGYPTKNGKITKKGVYLRAASTSHFTDSDIEKLINYNVTLEIDLRSEFEVKSDPSKLIEIPSIKYKSISMLDGFGNIKEGKKMPTSMYEVYRDLLETSKKEYKKIFKLFLENQGVSLFHCSAGKDRTGVLAFLILGLAGVDDDIIIRDYAATEEYLQNFLTDYIEKYKDDIDMNFPKFLLGAKAEDMEKTIKYVKDNYGTVKDYLLTTGLTEAELDKLNRKFVI